MIRTQLGSAGGHHLYRCTFTTPREAEDAGMPGVASYFEHNKQKLSPMDVIALIQKDAQSADWAPAALIRRQNLESHQATVVAHQKQEVLTALTRFEQDAMANAEMDANTRKVVLDNLRRQKKFYEVASLDSGLDAQGVYAPDEQERAALQALDEMNG